MTRAPKGETNTTINGEKCPLYLFWLLRSVPKIAFVPVESRGLFDSRAAPFCSENGSILWPAPCILPLLPENCSAHAREPRPLRHPIRVRSAPKRLHSVACFVHPAASARKLFGPCSRVAPSPTPDPRPLRHPIRTLSDSRSAPARPVNRLPVNPFTPPLPLLPALNEKGASPGRETLRVKSLSHKREGVLSSSWHRSSGSPVR